MPNKKPRSLPAGIYTEAAAQKLMKLYDPRILLMITAVLLATTIISGIWGIASCSRAKGSGKGPLPPLSSQTLIGDPVDGYTSVGGEETATTYTAIESSLGYMMNLDSGAFEFENRGYEDYIFPKEASRKTNTGRASDTDDPGTDNVPDTYMLIRLENGNAYDKVLSMYEALLYEVMDYMDVSDGLPFLVMKPYNNGICLYFDNSAAIAAGHTDVPQTHREYIIYKGSFADSCICVETCYPVNDSDGCGQRIKNMLSDFVVVYG